MKKSEFIQRINLSRALRDKLARHPEWTDEISAKCGARLSRHDLKAGLDTMVGSGSDDELFTNAIRLFKYKHLARIAAADMAAVRQVSELLAEWSDVADIIIDAAYNRAFALLSAKPPAPKPCAGSIIAMGKLGGGELNISSDVDLIFIYSEDNEPKDGSLSNHEFFVELALLVTKFLSRVTEDGFAFRVDHELRPEGPQGPLANSLDAAIHYYESFGRDWERQAFIRARPVAGDLTLGQKLVDELRPFIYRRSISIADIAHMREMKQKMEAKSYSATMLHDIKTGPGGIREAEFLVQAIQSLNGGAKPDLRRTNTFDAIEAALRNSLIHPHGAVLLKDAYSFLRRLENMIQVADDVQTHRIPADEMELKCLAKRMGYSDKDTLLADIKKHTRGVQILFHALFEEDYDRKELEEALSDNLSRTANEEEEADSLAWFVRGEKLRLARLDLEAKIDLKRLLERLAVAADVALKFAWQTSAKRLCSRYGRPHHPNGNRASFAIIGMGKLGSRETDYGSDLDLCFLYSGEGETSGPSRISNVEFFTRLSQRIITLISLPTRYGRAYMVDSELRPSGRSGALVATLDSFSKYHMESAGIWERLALLKARAVTGDAAFVKKTQDALLALAYKLPPPASETLAAEINRLRNKSLREKLKQHEGVINLKYARGGISDLESVIQYHHLLNASGHETLWKQNTFEVIESLAGAKVIDTALHDRLLGNLTFYRRLLSSLRLVSQSSIDTIDARSPQIESIAMQLGAQSADEIAISIENTMREVAAMYDKFIADR